MDNLKERSLRVQKEEKSRPRWFLFRAPAGRPDPHLPVFFVLLYSVILGLRPCWGADMRGRMFSNIFLMFRLVRIRFFCRRKRFSVSALFGFVSCQLLRSFQYNWLVCKTARMQLSSWMWKKESLPDPGLVQVFPFLDPQKSFFQVRIRIRILLCEVETVRLLILTVIWCKW